LLDEEDEDEMDELEEMEIETNLQKSKEYEKHLKEQQTKYRFQEPGGKELLKLPKYTEKDGSERE
jgi:hypothetical protein